ncbi:MAG: hypothetical protein ACJ74W_18410 [Pyrinomonadaceae bacterium]
MPKHLADCPDRAPRSRRALRILLALCLGVLSPAAPLIAQQQGDAAAQLREQIAALSAAEKDAALPAELRSANREFINQRRAELLGMLKEKAATLRNYLSTVGHHLSPAEKQPFEKTLVAVEEEVARLGHEVGRAGDERAAAPPATAPLTETPDTASALRASRRGAGAAPATETNTAADAPPVVEAAPAPAAIQSGCYPDAPQPLLQAVNAAAQRIVSRKDPGEVSTQISFILLFTVADAVSDEAEGEHREFINRIDILRAKQETKRTDKQLGASARAEGSTSAAEKPSVAELLGFAIEHGAIQQSVNGTTLTLSTTPYALLLAGRDDTAANYRQNSDWTRLGVSATFNISDENSPLLSARRQQLTEWSAKYRFLGDLSTRSKNAQAIWDKKVRVRVGQFPARVQEGLKDIFNRDRELAAKEQGMAASFTAPDFAPDVQVVLDDSGASDTDKQTRIAALLLCKARMAIYEPAKSGALMISADLKNRILTHTLPEIAAALAEREDAIKEFKDELKALSERPVLTFAYTNKREAVGSDYSNLRLLYSKKSAGGMNIIANGGVSFYHRPDNALNQQRVRDIAAALSFEGTAGRSPFMLEGEDESRITFAFTGRYQRMFENRGVVGRKADIAVGQFKIEVPVFAGMTLPFSVTYANATELVKENHVRANFGFSLDTDKLRQVLLLGALRRVR